MKQLGSLYVLQAIEQLNKIARKDNNPQRQAMDIGARLLLEVLAKHDRLPLTDVYSDEDGEDIVFEWQYPDERIDRIWIEGINHGEAMRSFGDGTKTQFKSVTWTGLPDCKLTFHELKPIGEA